MKGYNSETRRKGNASYFSFRIVVILFITCLTTMAWPQTPDTSWTEKWEGDWTQNWHVDAGSWDAGIPTSGPGKAYRGQKCAATVLTGNYSEPAETKLIRHTSFVVPSKTQNPRLRFWHWYSFSSGDFGEVQISTDGGTKWTTISTSYTSTSSGVWTYPLIDLSAYAGLNVQIAFRFHAHQVSCCSSDISSGWYIDEVALITGPITFNTVEGFEAGIGDWASERGTWEVGKPATGKAFTGQNYAATVINGNYSEPVDSRLISPLFVVPNKNQNPRLRFWHWYSFSSGDYGEVQIKVGKGAWKAISTSYTNTGSNVWTYPLIDLSAYSDSTVQIAFYFHSHQVSCCSSDISSGWYIDEVALITGPITFNTVEGFEAGIGDWASERGTWEVGKPATGKAFAGQNYAATVINGNYSEPVDSRLISPPFVVPNKNQNPRLRFWHWYSFSSGDYGEVQIRIGDGVWKTISTSYTSTSSNVWTYPLIDLSAYSGLTVRIAFYFHSHQVSCCSSDISSGWYIDEIALVQGPIVFRNPENFEFGIGDWAAERGTWEVGKPTAGPDTAYSPPNCAGTVLGGNYSEPVDSRLISPPFVVSKASNNPALRFRHWYSFSSGDYGEVQIKVGDGQWQRIPNTNPFVNTSSNVWTPFFVPLTAYVDSTVRIGFYFHSHQVSCCASDVSRGWYIDNVQIDPVQTCTYIISPTSQSFPAGGGTGSVNVMAITGCQWTAVSNVNWIKIISGSNGNGNGTVNYSVDPNTGTSTRTGTMTIAGQPVTITQAACVITISPPSQSFDANGGAGSVNVTAESGCAWTATRDSSWIMITAGNSGSGNGTVTYSVKPNSSSRSRSGTLTIAGQKFTVTQAEKLPGIPIFPTATSPQFATQEFWVDVKVGDVTSPTANLFGVSFCLTFTNTNFIDVVTPYASTVTSGDFLGNDVVFQSNVDEAAGKVCIGISRKAGQSGVNGSGTLVRIKFIARPNIPDKTQTQFCVTEVVANDPNGNSISLTPSCATVTINQCLTVWPGDTNNDGKVDQVDVLPLGLYWGRTGSACASSQSCAWNARCCTPWTTLAATYADANGDGVVNQVDVLCLGLNWNKTHTTNLPLASGVLLEKTGSVASASLAPDVKPVQAPNQEFFVRIKASEVNNLFGLSFELLYDQSNFVQILAVEPDSLLGSDVVFYSNVEASAGKIAVGISRKAGQTGVTGTGSTVRVKAIISSNIPDKTIIRFSLQNAVANDANGAPIQLALQSASTTVMTTAIVSHEALFIPTEYRLEQNHPNPFNPATTIRFALPHSAHVTLRIFDLVGREIATLVDDELAAGRHETRWEANGVESGVYLYQLRAGEFVETKRLLVVK